MPYSIDFRIAGRGEPPRDVYRALHANLLRWIAAVDAGTAAAIHDRPVRKPFTVSALQSHRDGLWRWRVTLIDDGLWPALWEGAQKKGTLDLDGQDFVVCTDRAEGVYRSYDELITAASPSAYLRMAFVSPTTFRMGEIDSPLPEPGAAFQSWLSHWNDFAPPHRHISTDLLNVVRASVAIAEIRDLHTERHDLGKSSPVGFMGQVTYAILRARSLNQADVWRLNTLAAYAEFCGTGRKTTQGMGQTRRLDTGR